LRCTGGGRGCSKRSQQIGDTRQSPVQRPPLEISFKLGFRMMTWRLSELASCRISPS
jgi:hypothetical protein